MNRYPYKVAILFLLVLVAPPLCHAWSGKVVHVSEGDTITVLKEGKEIEVRLYGINSPERTQWYGNNAKSFTSAQVMRKTVKVREIDVDRYGWVVGVVTVGDLVLNKFLLEQGYAWLHDRYCKKPFCFPWAKAEHEAKKAKRGLWKNPKSIPPWEYKKGKRGKSSGTRTTALRTVGSGCDCSRNRHNCKDFKTLLRLPLKPASPILFS